MKQYSVDEQLTKIFEKLGAFYAFGDEQFNEQKKEGVQYANVGAGLICPRENVRELREEIKKAVSGKIEWELANNTKKEIIWHQLANFECQVSNWRGTE